MKFKHVFRDPRFHALPHIDKLKVLYRLDPEYRKLDPQERWKIVQAVPTPPKIKPDTQAGGDSS